MKNKIYILGIVTCLLIGAGCLFKLMHWLGANVLIASGILILCFLFMPTAFRSSFKAESDKKLKMLYVITALVMIINFLAALFKIMRWPGGNWLLLLSLPLPFVILLPAYLKYYSKESEINYKHLMAILFFFAYFAAISALLALGVSKNVLNSYIKSAYQVEQKTEIVSQQCKLTLNSITADTTNNKEVLDQCQAINKQAEVLCEKIENLKQMLVINNSGNPEKCLNPNSYRDKNKIDLYEIKNKDSRPSIDYYYIDELKNELNIYKALIASSSQYNNAFNNYVETIFNTSDTYDDSWDDNFMKNQILISLIEKLDFLEYHIRLAEYEVLSEI